jgi:hypothetical protein
MNNLLHFSISFFFFLKLPPLFFFSSHLILFLSSRVNPSSSPSLFFYLLLPSPAFHPLTGSLRRFLSHSLSPPSPGQSLSRSISLRQNHLQPSLSLPPAVLQPAYPQPQVWISSLVTTRLSLSSLWKLSQTRVGLGFIQFFYITLRSNFWSVI